MPVVFTVLKSLKLKCQSYLDFSGSHPSSSIERRKKIDHHNHNQGGKLLALNLSISQSPSRFNTIDDDRVTMMSGGGGDDSGKHNWDELPKDALDHIVHSLGAYADYVRVRAVCGSWRSSLPNRPSDHYQLLPRQLPWLVLQSKHNLPVSYVPPRQLCYGFFSFSEKKIHRLLDSINNGSGLHLIGSTRGWLVTVEEMNLSVMLLNPITGHRIPLPPLTTFPCYVSPTTRRNDDPHAVYHKVSILGKFKVLNHREMCCSFLSKVILTSNPTTTTTFMIIAKLFRQYLGLFKPENGEWTLIDHKVEHVVDILYFKGKIYLLDIYTGVYAYDMSSDEVKVIVKRSNQSEEFCFLRFYLLEMCGELLVVIRRIEKFLGINHARNGILSFGFEVFKVDESQESLVELKCLGDRALFLGGKTGSVAFSADEECGGMIKRNCIYFTNHCDSRYDGSIMDQDFGVFNLEDGSIQPIPFLQIPKPTWPSAIWLIPDP